MEGYGSDTGAAENRTPVKGWFGGAGSMTPHTGSHMIMMMMMMIRTKVSGIKKVDRVARVTRIARVTKVGKGG